MQDKDKITIIQRFIKNQFALDDNESSIWFVDKFTSSKTSPQYLMALCEAVFEDVDLIFGAFRDLIEDKGWVREKSVKRINNKLNN